MRPAGVAVEPEDAAEREAEQDRPRHEQRAAAARQGRHTRHDVAETGTAQVLRQPLDPAGDVVVYPTTSLHRVEPVTRGTRRAAVSWVESHIPDERARRILVDMSEVKEFLERTAPQAPETDTFRNCVFNLMRLWWRT